MGLTCNRDVFLLVVHVIGLRAGVQRDMERDSGCTAMDTDAQTVPWGPLPGAHIIVSVEATQSIKDWWMESGRSKHLVG
jgi:hypothetical protein